MESPHPAVPGGDRRRLDLDENVTPFGAGFRDLS
jgi:hypothetical protein